MSGGGRAPRAGREAALACLFFFALTVLMTWPQAAHLDDAMTDLWDSKLNARIVQWDYHQTLHDPVRLFELNFFHPAQDVLAFSENLWGVSLFGYPLLAAGASPLLNYNVVLLLGMFLSALSAWALARYVTADPLASAVAGLVYAFVPWRFSQISHLQHQWGAFLCLMLLFLLRYLDHGKRRDLVLLTICFAWNALSNVHYAIFSAFLVAVPLVLFVLDRGSAGLRRAGAALLGIGLGGCAFVPFALEYRRASELYGFRRHWSEMLFYSRSWRDFLSAGWHNRTWGPLTTRWEGPEGDFFPGLASLALASWLSASSGGQAMDADRRKLPRGAGAPRGSSTG